MREIVDSNLDITIQKVAYAKHKKRTDRIRRKRAINSAKK